MLAGSFLDLRTKRSLRMLQLQSEPLQKKWSLLQICSHLLKKSLMENFILCAVNIEVCTTFEIFSGLSHYFFP